MFLSLKKEAKLFIVQGRRFCHLGLFKMRVFFEVLFTAGL